MAESDFERVCAAFMDAADPSIDAAEIRYGMAAALREMREPGEDAKNAVRNGGAEMRGVNREWFVLDAWQAMIDALLAQAEDREAAQ